MTIIYLSEQEKTALRQSLMWYLDFTLDLKDGKSLEDYYYFRVIGCQTDMVEEGFYPVDVTCDILYHANVLLYEMAKADRLRTYQAGILMPIYSELQQGGLTRMLLTEENRPLIRLVLNHGLNDLEGVDFGFSEEHIQQEESKIKQLLNKII